MFSFTVCKYGEAYWSSHKMFSVTVCKYIHSKWSPHKVFSFIICKYTHTYEVWIQSNANVWIKRQRLELGGCLFLKIFRRICRRGERAFCSAPPSFWRRRRRRRRSEVWRPPPRRSWSWPGPGSGLPAPILAFLNKTKSVGARKGE